MVFVNLIYKYNSLFNIISILTKKHEIRIFIS